ncbi:hypothetical protein MCCPF38_00722 [Mycoplasma capricolum subsp. capripneumoniae]|nr:hypothetical protein MCCPF38_00722 [Mycoplasma capricolum subsp. capripneumoniae]
MNQSYQLIEYIDLKEYRMLTQLKKYKISDIRLLPVNPRFTPSIQVDVLKINYVKQYNSMQYSIIEKMLEHEDDWSYLYQSTE